MNTWLQKSIEASCAYDLEFKYNEYNVQIKNVKGVVNNCRNVMNTSYISKITNI